MMVAPLPTWKQLFLNQNKIECGYWSDSLFTSRSGVSIRLIIEAYRRVFDVKHVKVWVPTLFCAETEAEFVDNDVELVRYPITNCLEPDWVVIKKQAADIENGIFIFVHYFGEYHDINRARVFCDQKKMILIEDCAHVLYRYKKIGQNGDFVLFSPHKILPVPDGGIIRCNENEYNTELCRYMKELSSEIDETKKSTIAWKMKRIIQKIIRRNKPVHYALMEHYLRDKPKREKRVHISKYSHDVLQGYTYEKLKKIAYIRRENEQQMTFLLKSLEPDIVSLISEENECPFFAVYSLDKVCDKQALVKKLQNLGIQVMFWPTLSPEVAELECAEIARTLSKNLIVIPIHQGIAPQQIAKITPVTGGASEPGFVVEEICADTEGFDAWSLVINKVQLSNITQDWAYGDSKVKADNWKLRRFIAYEEKIPIGAVQVLSKKIFGITILARVNKGPLFIKGKDRIENELDMVRKIRRKYFRFVPFLYVPYSIMTPENYVKMIGDGWYNWDIFGFPSGTVDLTRSTDQIRSSLNSKWRNQLKTAEKKGYQIRTDKSKIDEMLQRYEEEQSEKGFQGVSRDLLKEILANPKDPMKVYYVENNQHELIAFDFFYRHSDAATYYIGWNSEEGRRGYLNNLLLYHAALSLKDEGVKTLDLGGIEYIHTESIARFKDGMNPSHFRQMGEFIKAWRR